MLKCSFLQFWAKDTELVKAALVFQTSVSNAYESFKSKKDPRRRKPENNSSLRGSQTRDVKILEQHFREKRYQNK